MINELNPEQIELMAKIRDEWIDAFDTCGDIVDEKQLTDDIAWVYSLANLAAPQVLIVDSPMAAQMVANMIKKTDKPKFFPFGYYMGSWDFGWSSFYDFFDRIGVDLECEHWARWRRVVRSNMFCTIQFDGLCVVSRMPLFIRRESREGRMHSVIGPSIRFRDGFELFNLWGVEFPADLYWKLIRRQISATEVLTIENIEQRMAALKFLGAQAVLAAFDTKIIDEQQGYKLHEIKGLTDDTEYALQYACPSTAREYVSFVKPEIGAKKDAILAIASKWEMSKEQWNQIGAHS